MLGYSRIVHGKQGGQDKDGMRRFNSPLYTAVVRVACFNAVAISPCSNALGALHAGADICHNKDGLELLIENKADHQ